MVTRTAFSNTDRFPLSHRIAVLCLFLVGLGASDTSAQIQPTVGSTVRIQFEPFRLLQDQPPYLQGVVTALGSDSLTLTLDPAAAEARVAWDRVHRLFVSSGRRSRLRTVFDRAIGGAISGALLGVLAHEILTPQQARSTSVLRFTGSLAAVSAATGIFGERGHHWVRAELPGRAE